MTVAVGGGDAVIVAVAVGRGVADGVGEGLDVAPGVSVGGAVWIFAAVADGEPVPDGAQAARRKNIGNKNAIFKCMIADCNPPGRILRSA